jgi:NADH:ubiquinone oxidoreductase subunit F (NADH-binding)
MLVLLDKINRGKAKKKDLEQLKKIALAMQKASLCGLGQTAPNPVLSTLKFYEDEYTNKLADAEKK